MPDMPADTSEAADTRPRCVFCDAPWSAEMLRLYEAGSNGAGCACCVIFPDFEEVAPPPPPTEHIQLPPDLSCHACGRVLYRLAASVLEDGAAPTG